MIKKLKQKKRKDILFLLAITMGVLIMIVVTGTTWQNINSNDFNNGTYYNTTYLISPETSIGAVILNTTYQEFPNSQLDDSFGETKINMTGNILLVHMNNDWLDYSGLENNGGSQGGVSFLPSSTLGSHTGNFDGNDDYVNITDTPNLDGSGDLTITAWVKLNNSYRQPFVAKTLDANNVEYFLGTGSNNGLVGLFRNGAGGLEATSGGAILSTDVWYHVAYVFDAGSNSKIFLNGILNGSDASFATAPPEISNDLRIGYSEGFFESYLNGTINEVAMWNRTLSASEILNIYNKQYGTYYKEGEYVSEIVDLGSSMNFNNFSWIQGAQYQQELPNSQLDELSTTKGGANMTGNVLLLHMNNDWLDSSGLSNDGSESGDAMGFTTSSKLGSHAGSFGGSSDYLNVSDATSLGFTNTFTLMTWIYPTSLAGSDRAIFSKGDGHASYLTREYYLKIEDDDDKLRIYINADAEIAGTTALSENTWQHVAVTYDGTNTIIYLDGAEDVSSTASSGNIYNSVNPLLLGGAEYNAGIIHSYVGRMDESSIWNRTLSATEIEDVYKRGTLELNLSVRSCDDALCDAELWNGTYTNSSYVDISDLTSNQYFQYKFFFSSDDSNGATPELFNITLDYVGGVSDTCTYSGSGNWAVTCSDSCAITENISMGKNNISFHGEGTVNVYATISNWKEIYVHSGCEVSVWDGGSLESS